MRPPLTNLGTPDNPNRSNSLHARYWEGYFGWRKPSEFEKDSIAYLCVKAGRDDARKA